MNTIVTRFSLADSRLASVPSSAAHAPLVLSVDGESNTSNTEGDTGTVSTLSTLARQLSAAAERAEARDTLKDARDTLAAEACLANKAQSDSEGVERLARARQATGFIDGADSNPFKGLARDQLNLIAHDEGGSFTINERRAAWKELQASAASGTTTPADAPANGRELLLSRLFLGVEPPVAKAPMTMFNMSQSAYDFLTVDDRDLLSQMYAYAQAQGADLRNVDNVAGLLGDYRHHNDGRQLLNANNGKGYDLEGYMVTVGFQAEDAATASRILNGSAISSTLIDQGFLRHFLDPGYGALKNTSDLAFLEQMVIKFSAEGAAQTSLDSKFASYQSISINDNVVVTTHKNVKLPPFKAHVTNVDGVWTLTEKGKAAGYMLDKTTGRLIEPAARPDDQAPVTLGREPPNRTVMDFSADRRDPPGTRWLMPGNLFKLMRNFMS